MRPNRIVFGTAATVSTAFVAAAAVMPERMAALFGALQSGIVGNFGWFYIVSVAAFLVFALYMMFGRYGRVRLGDDDDEPDYSYATWFSMLFSAGMGIGLLFYGVAEPMLHFGAPRFSEPGSVEAAKEAMETAFFHWGLHAWAIYIIVGLSLAYFGYRQKLPLTIRSTLYPLLGDRIHGPIGHVVDVMAIFGTLFGVATSLGFGVLQVNSGLEFLGWLPKSTANQILLIAAITALTTISVFTGLDRGIRRLSELNVALGVLLVIFVFLAGPTVFLLSTFVESVGLYFQDLILNSFRTTAFAHTEWQKSWTMFYWGWWISWAPFVGMFIARISRGRTIREFVAGVMFVPALFTFFWFVVMGNTAIHMDLFQNGQMAAAVAEDVATALFKMLSALPLAEITVVIATAMVATFFVTSADSGALVIDIIANNGRTDGAAWRRVFWAVSTGSIAAVLLLVGGLKGLQTAAITTALPFALIMVAMCFSLLIALHAEGEMRHGAAEADGEVHAPAGESVQLPAHVPDDWAARLAYVTERHRTDTAHRDPQRDAIAAAMRDEIMPALRQIAAEMRRHGRQVTIDHHPLRIGLSVLKDGREEFYYHVRGRISRHYSATMSELARDDTVEAPQGEVVVRGGLRRTLPLSTMTSEWIREDFLGHYARWVGF